jgi:hypothetical protein
MVILNEINLSYLYPQYPYKQGLITTADEYSYFYPAEHFCNSGEWNETSSGDKAYLRTPGYGSLYLLAYFISAKHAFLVLKIIQIGFFSGSLLLLNKVLSIFLYPKNALFATFLYGILPCFNGFTYYTLSESILPFFIIWWIYSIFNTDKKVALNLIFSTSTLVLIRPQLIVFPLVFLVFYLLKKNRRSFYLLIGLTPLLFWHIRTVLILQEWGGLHPVYSVKNNTIFRPPHKELTELFKIWEYESDVFHTNMGILSSDTSVVSRNNVAATIPKSIRNEVIPVLQKFQQFRYMQQSKYAGVKLNDYLPGEKRLTIEIRNLRQKIKHENLVLNHLVTPFNSSKKLIFSSMMNLNIYQEQWRNNIFVWMLKGISFVLIFSGFITTLLLSISRQTEPEFKLLAISVIVSIFYLIYFQRLNEERYLYPYLCIFFLLMCALAAKVRSSKLLSNKKG